MDDYTSRMAYGTTGWQIVFIPAEEAWRWRTRGHHVAIELKADAVLMDDRDGTKEARRNHITVFGTLVLLDRAAERDLLSLPAALARLAQTTFRFPAAEVIAEMLERDMKRKQAREE